MRFFKRLSAWLKAPPTNPSIAKLADPEGFDLEGIEQTLSIRAEAHRLAILGQPSPNETQLSGVEARIVQRIEKLRSDYVAWAARRLQSLNYDLVRCNARPDIDWALQAHDEFERKAGLVLSTAHKELNRLGERKKRLGADLRSFQGAHNLSRDAYQPKIKLLRIAILVALVLFEGAVNAVFFAEGVSTGYLGGFTFAAGLALINVAGTFFLGSYGIRYLFHRNWLVKSVGIASSTLAIAWMTLVALSIAHMRDALTAGVLDPSGVALTTLISTPFHLATVSSWLLFAISAVFGFIALIDGLAGEGSTPFSRTVG